MTEPNAFDAKRDPTIGAWLRDHYDGEGEDGFVAAVMARVAREPRQSSWDVLAAWAPLGMAAAALLALAAGLGLGLAWRTPTTEPVTDRDPVEWLSGTEPVTSELVLTAVLSGNEFGLNGEQR